jgi:hypothetical protein
MLDDKILIVPDGRVSILHTSLEARGRMITKTVPCSTFYTEDDEELISSSCPFCGISITLIDGKIKEGEKLCDHFIRRSMTIVRSMVFEQEE